MGACHAHTAISSTTEAGTGGKQRGASRTGSNLLPARPSAISGAAKATTPMCIIMCAEKDPDASSRNEPNQTNPSVSSPPSSSAPRISDSSR
jgi:hypothetical protein